MSAHGQRQPADGTPRIRPSAPVAAAASALAAAGVGPARVEAELLAAYVLGVPRARLALVDGFTPGQLDRFDGLVVRRTRREPLQYLLGSAAFRHIELAVGPGVFIPRPETELLAGWGIEQVRAFDAARASARSELASPAAASGEVGASARSERSGAAQAEPGGAGMRVELASPAAASGPTIVVDLCSGTGAIALAVANEAPTALVVAVERAIPALGWLRRNAAERAAAGDRPVEVVAGDATDPRLLDELTGRVDVLLSNPPYVPDGTVVAPEVADHDPAEAVFAGPDGLAVIRPLIARAAALLRPGGVLGIEHDDTHAESVPALLRMDGRFVEVADHPDLSGRPRFTTARRAAAGPAPAAPWQTGSS